MLQKVRVNEVRKWCKDNLGVNDVDKKESVLTEALREIGCKINSIYDVTSCDELRKYLSELILHRHTTQIKNSREYLEVVECLLGYIEWLENENASSAHKSSKNKLLKERDKTIDSLTVAYYLSRVDKEALKQLGYTNYTDAFKKLATILGQKASTIKNMRDEFDPYFDNGRKGWYQRELRGTRKEVFDMYSSVSDRKLAEVVKDILALYSGETSAKVEQPHTRIKIGSNNMKEIRSRKR